MNLHTSSYPGTLPFTKVNVYIYIIALILTNEEFLLKDNEKFSITYTVYVYKY